MMKPTVLLTALLLVGSLTPPAALATQPAGDAEPGSAPQGIESLAGRVKEHTLANGMKFLLLERHTSPTVSFHVYFNVGSVDEELGVTGIAHMYEHMAFKGTRQIGTKNYQEEVKHFPKIDQLEADLTAERDKGAAADQAKITHVQEEIAKEVAASEQYVISNEIGRIFERNGGSSLNAQTERDQTHYSVNLPANKIELWMAVESDRMQNTVLRQFYKERDVVMEEVRRTIDTNPLAKLLLQETITTALHAHPYGLHSGIGWTSDVSHLTRTQVEQFFHKYYGAANATVAIVGDFDSAKLIPMIDRYFAAIPAGEKTPRRVTIEPPQEGERRTALEAATQAAVVLAYHRPDVKDKDDIVYDVISQLLAQGRTSRFYRNLIEGKQVATDVEAFPLPILITGKYPSLFEIFALPAAPGHTVADVETAIYAELDKLKTTPVDKEELEKIINNVDAGFVRGMASNEKLAELLVFTEALEGSWKEVLTYRQRIAAVTPDDIMRVARQAFSRTNRTVAFITSKEEEPAAAAPAPAKGPASAEELARGKQIFDQAVAAAGGAEKIKSLSDYSIRGTATLSFSGQEIKANIFEQVALPDKSRNEISLPAMKQEIVQVMSGASAWQKQGGQTAEMPAAAAQAERESAARDRLNYFLSLPDGSAAPRAVPDVTVDGKAMDAIQISGPGDFTMTMVFDKQSHRLIKSLYRTNHPATQQQVAAEEIFDGYKEQRGMWIPIHSVLFLAGEKFSDVTISEVKINSGLAASTFEKP